MIFSMRKIIFSLLLFWVGIGNVQAAPEYFFQGTETDSYQQFFEEGGISVVRLGYKEGSLFEVKDKTEKEIKNEIDDEAQEIEEKLNGIEEKAGFTQLNNKEYSIEVEDPHAALQFFFDFEKTRPSFFKVIIVTPTGKEWWYYNASEILLTPPEKGWYKISVILKTDESISYKLTAKDLLWDIPTTLRAPLMIEPEDIFSEQEVEQIQKLWEKKNSIFIIGNKKMGENFKTYFTSTEILFSVDQATEEEGKEQEERFGFEKGDEIETIETEFQDKNCASINHLMIEEGVLLTRWYCMRPESEAPYTLAFISPSIFPSDSGKAQILDSLRPPSSFALWEGEGGVINEFFFGSIKGSMNYLFILLLTIVGVYGIKKNIPTLWEYNSKWKTKEIIKKIIEKTTQRLGKYIFWAFIIVGIIFLYNFFIFERKLEIWFAFTIILGILNYLMVQIVDPLLIKCAIPMDSKFFKIIYGALGGLIGFLFLTLLSINPPNVSQEEETLIPISQKGEHLAIMVSQKGENAMAWSLGGGSVLLKNGGFAIGVDTSGFSFLSTGEGEINILMKGNAILITSWLAEDQTIKGQKTFILTDGSFSLIKKTGGVSFYRRSTAISYSMNGEENWATALKNSLPLNTNLFIGPDVSFKENDFWITTPPGETEGNEFQWEGSIGLDDATFYTYANEPLEGFFIVSSEMENEQKVVLKIENEKGEIIFNQEVELNGKEKDKKINFSIIESEKEVYKIYFENGSEEIEPSPFYLQIKSIYLNSPYLVFQSDQVKISEETNFYISGLNKNDILKYNSESLFSFHELGGELMSNGKTSGEEINTMIWDFSTGYTLTTPALQGTLNSERKLFYSFSEESWFNPWIYNIYTEITDEVDYLIVTDSTFFPAQKDEEGWLYFSEATGVLSDYNGGEIFIQFEFATQESNPWAVINKITFNPSKK